MSIQALLTHREPLVRELAEKATRYKDEFDRGLINRAEYDSLCRQLVDLKALNERALATELRLELQQAVQILRAFLGFML